MPIERRGALASVADSVVDALTPFRHRSLPPELVDVQLRELRHNATERHQRLKQIIGSRRRWSQLTEEEVVDLVESRIRRRANHRTSMASRDQGDFVAR